MSQRQPAAEYAQLLDAIERLAFGLGRIEVELADLRRRADRIEARVASLNQPVAVPERQDEAPPEDVVAPESLRTEAAIAEAAVPEPAETEVAAVEPAFPEPTDTEPIDGEPAFAEPVDGPSDISEPDVSETAIAEPEPDGQPAFEAAVVPRSSGAPVFTKIVAAPVAEGHETVRSVALVPVPMPEFAAEHEPIWARVPERYRRAAWIAAPLVAVMVVSTWITSADSPEAAPTPHTEVGAGISRTSTPLGSGTSGEATQPGMATPHAGMVASPTTPASPLATATVRQASTPTPTASPPAPTSTVPATTTPTGNESPTATTAAVTPTTASTAATVAPTEPPVATVAPTVAGQPGQIVPGGVGSTETMVVETFGTADGEQDGRSTYSEGSVLVTYGPGTLATRVTFVLDLDDLTMPLADARGLVEFYRPPDAQLLSETTDQPGLVRRVYSSATLGALFAGTDTGGRTADHYVEELRFDPATQRALAIEMALGDRP
jgi:hypothetical protein